ncbi:MAG: DUF2628 domain-containing protein [Alphaproteobacteria bacterium]|nr:DUF2628 domain-containing protein [Alphaproteobacteria bacterium]
MKVWTVHHRASAPDLPDVVLVKEGFCWPALLVPPLWMIWHRLWLALVVYVALVVGAAGIGYLAGFGEVGETALGLAVGIWVAWTANDWRRAKLDRLGFREIAVTAGDDMAEAEERFFRGPAAQAAFAS